jgi:isoquinoline 1-oxidoreductase subunit beta
MRDLSEDSQGRRSGIRKGLVMTEPSVNRGRRRFLKVGVAAGAGLVLGAYFGFGGEKIKAGATAWDDRVGAFTPDAWLQIRKDESIIVRVNHSEMGQGITTALPMIVAEELGADFSYVRFEIAPAETVYKNPQFSTQMTAASTSVKTSFDLLRRVGAMARQMLILAAAEEWQVRPSECTVENGLVSHKASGCSASFGSLVDRASGLPVPTKVDLKRPEEYGIIGKPLLRLDAIEKIKGAAVFGTDIKLPGLLHATVVHPPVFGSGISGLEADRTKAMPGVRRVLVIDSGVAVVADTTYQALQGAQALKITWKKPVNGPSDSEAISRRWAELSDKKGARTVYERGDADTSLETATRRLSAVYELPYQAHAAPEPVNCTAHVRKGRCDVWASTQNQDAAREMAARIARLKYEAVKVHTPYLGGGFGRRVAVDYVAEAVQISGTMGRPVKVIWSREEDVQHDFYRPASYNTIQAGLDGSGRVVAWKQRIVGPDNMAVMLPLIFPSMIPYAVPRLVRNVISSAFKTMAPTMIAGKKIIEGAELPSYAIDNVKVEHLQDDPGIPTGFWRSVAFSSNAFVVECFIDEIAAATGKDPSSLRHELLKDNPPFQRVLSLAAEKAGWGAGPSRGLSQGVACLNMHNTLLAYVAEVSVEKENRIKVHRIVTAIDCGIVINPNIVKAQIEGAIAFGLTAAMKGAVTIKKGRVEQSNLHDFPLLRMDEMPKVEVYIADSTRSPTGVGEMGVPLVAPAVANALFAATGKRIRRLPIRTGDL